MTLCTRLIGKKNPPPKKGEKGFVQWMAGVHIGLVLPLVYCCIFMFRAQKIYRDPEAFEKTYLVRPLRWKLCCMICATHLLTLFLNSCCCAALCLLACLPACLFACLPACHRLAQAHALSLLAAGSAVAFALLVRLKPKKKDAGSKK